MKAMIKKTRPKAKAEGFGSVQRLTHYQSFSCECLFYDATLDEELLIELWEIRIGFDYNAETRKAIAAGIIYCFLGTKEAEQRGINRVFFWNNKTRAYEPLGAISNEPLPGSESVGIEINPDKTYEQLLEFYKVEILVTKAEG